MYCMNDYLNEVYPEEPSVQKSKARNILDLVDYITDKNSAGYLQKICGYLRKICTLFTT